MADYILEARLKLKDEFSSTLKKAKSGFQSIGSSLDKNSGKIKETFQGVNKEFKSLKNMALGAVAIGTAVGLGAWKMYTGYAELNKQLVKNRALSKMNIMEQVEIEKQVENLGKTTIFTAKQVAEAQQYQFMAGYKVNEVLAITPKLLKLSVASGEDLASTSDMITDSLSAFGIGIKDIDNFLDVLVNTANNTNTSVGQLGGAFKYIASSSKGFGESFEEVAVMLGMLGDNGLKAEEAGARLRGTYAKLATITPKLGRSLKKEGIEIYDKTTKKMKPLREIIEQTSKAMKGMSDEKKNKMLTKMVGVQNISAFLSLMNNAEESTKKAENAVYGAKGSLDAYNKTVEQTDSHKIALMSSSFEALKLSVGKALSPTMMKGMEQLTTYMNELGDSGQLSSENVELFFNTMKENVGSAVEVFAGLKAIMWSVNALFASSPAGWLMAGGYAVVKGWQTGKKIGSELSSSIFGYNKTDLKNTEGKEYDTLDDLRSKDIISESLRTTKTNLTEPISSSDDFSPTKKNRDEKGFKKEERYDFRKSVNLDDFNKNEDKQDRQPSDTRQPKETQQPGDTRQPSDTRQPKEQEYLKPVILSPIINITGNNTFNNGTDMNKLADEIVKQFNLTQ